MTWHFVSIGCSKFNQKVGNPKAFICCRIEEYGSQTESSALIISYLLTHASDSSVQGSD